MSVLDLPVDSRWQSLSPRIGRSLSRLAAALAKERHLRRQVAFLLQQDGRMLRDLGLSRSDVARSVRCGRDA